MKTKVFFYILIMSFVFIISSICTAEDKIQIPHDINPMNYSENAYRISPDFTKDINSINRSMKLAAVTNTSQWVMGYYVAYHRDWLPPENIDWSGITHIALGAILANEDGSLDDSFYIGTDGPAFAHKISQYAHGNNTKAILMFGGAGTGQNILSAVRDHRAVLISNLVAAMNNYGYDGIDLDWEDNVDWDLFEIFARELREAAPDAILTLPVGCKNMNYDPIVDPVVVNVSQFMDRVSLMSYYPSTAWAGSGWHSWHTSPLKGAKSTTPVSIEDSLSRYVTAGIPKSKLNMGMGFYAIGYQGGITAPNQPTTDNIIKGGDGDYTLSKLFGSGSAYNEQYRYWDPDAVVPYLSLPTPDSYGCLYVSFDDDQSIIEKGNFSRENGYGGIIIWTIDEGYIQAHSEPNFLMQALRKGFIDPNMTQVVGISVNPAITYVVSGTTTNFSTLVTGTMNKNVTWNIMEPGGGSISQNGIYTAPTRIPTGVIMTYHIRATSHADASKNATVTVNVGDEQTLAWDPGLHRLHCAEWWMEVFADDLNTTDVQLEHNGELISMDRASWDYSGKPLYTVSVQVYEGDIIKYHAISRDGRKATTLPIVYSFTVGDEIIDCPVPPPVDLPIASFVAYPTSGILPLNVSFNDTTTGGIPTAWNWSFGDGTLYNTTAPVSRNITKLYSTTGTFITKLQVSNEAGTNITSPGTTITVTSNLMPAITSISPVMGYPVQNWPMTITGTNFRPNAYVTINNSTVLKTGTITSLSGNQIVCIFPITQLAPGVYDVVVKNEDLTSANISQELYPLIISVNK